jgi:beta-lactamase regulating signal transducer with metallopeptidase domain
MFGMGTVSFLLLIWATVVLAIAGSLAFAALSVRRIVRRSQPLDSRDWLDPLWEVSDRLGLEEPPLVLRSEDAKMPFACGVLKPTIVLPADCDNWTLDRRRAVLLHELAHVKRHDLVGHTLGRLACAFYWFHPLVWTAAKNLRSESERACDDLALSCGARATDYAEHLLDIVTSVRGDSTPSVALAMARRKEFEGRMLAILDPELRHSTPSRRQSAVLISSLALMAVVIGAAAPAPRVADAAVATASEPMVTIAHNEVAAPRVADPGKRGASDTLDAGEDEESDFPVSEVERAIAAETATSIAPSVASSVASSVAASVSAAIASVAEPLTEKVASASRNKLMELVKHQGSSGTQGVDDRPALLARILLNDQSAELREIAAWGLHEHADAAVAANALATALRRDANEKVREMSAWSLHDADRSSVAIDALAAALRGDASVQVRATAAWTLGQIGEESAIEPLTAAMNDASAEVRRPAVWAMGQIEPKQAPRALIAKLSDSDPETRELVAWALFQIEDPAAIPALDAALRRETNKDLQIAYIRALAAVGEQSVDALRGLLESNDPEIKKIAVRALAGRNSTGPWPRPWPQPRPFP